MAKFEDTAPAKPDFLKREITWLRLRGHTRLVFEAPLPMSPEGLRTLSEIVQKTKVALRHYLTAEEEPAQ